MKNPTLTQLAVLFMCTLLPTLAKGADGGQQHREGTTTPPTKSGQPPRAVTDAKGSLPTGNVSKPHIVMIVVDDMGWNDVDWRDGSLHTPVMSRLASEGVVLTQAYVQPVCSPSRAAFLSGLYPYHLGLQHDSLRATQKAYLPGDVTTLPEYLKKLGYSTHMAGKWHLGFCNWKYTPTYRGFDSFVGFYNAIQDYYTHIGHHQGYDFRRNKEVYYEANGTYSAFIFTRYIEQVIGQHDPSRPLFVYLPYQSVHGPLQVPSSYLDLYCKDIQDANRRQKCGMLAVLDEAVFNVTLALKARGMFDDTLLLLTTDNGGPVHEGANNWPLRGAKTTLWEGGTRATAFLHAPRYWKKPGVYEGMIHAVDWLPTLVEAAGGRTPSGLDGVSQWQSLLQGKVPSARTEFLYNMDELKNNSALRQGRFKLLQGHPGHPDKWYPPPRVLPGRSSSACPEATSSQTLPEGYVERVATNSASSPYTVSMTSEGDDVTAGGGKEYQLYDLEADPTEHHDVKDKYPEVFQRMRARLEEYRKSLVPANFPPHDPAALPSHFNGVWSPGWC
ncbi:arylsulfatase B-like isoform X2 [Babylonia areolata]|uniref:arylsulfatase B-like isoform X2 n=1 Tax=Babylonia areolata TaxID=304850 RepID=UPI003FD48DA8